MNSIYEEQISLFMNTENTIEIKNKIEFSLFLEALEDLELLDKVLPKKNNRIYEYWKNLVFINSKGKYDLVFEYDEDKGLTFYTDREISINWYNKEPLRLYEGRNNKCKFCKTKHQSFVLNRISTLNEYFKVCPNCFSKYLDEIIKEEPISHKCDCCDSNDVYKITTSFKTYFLCKEHLIDFVCYNLKQSDFKSLYKTDSKGNCDFYLHDDFYDEDGIALQPNDEYVYELKKTL